MTTPTVCPHGSVPRACEICERDQRIDDLHSQVDHWRDMAERRMHLHDDLAEVLGVAHLAKLPIGDTAQVEAAIAEVTRLRREIERLSSEPQA